MNEPAGTRIRVGHCALTIAEYFRDDARQDVLLLIDNIFRFIQAGSEVSALTGQLPSRLGYQPTLGTELADLEERICNTSNGAITSVQAVYVPADDFGDPAAIHTFGHLSASIVLARKRASEGLYPAIDPLRSDSRMVSPAIVGTRHYRIAQEIRKTLSTYEELKDIIAMLGIEELSQRRPPRGAPRPPPGALPHATVLRHRADSPINPANWSRWKSRSTAASASSTTSLPTIPSRRCT